MTRRSVQETRRFHLFLYKGDLDYLERRFGTGAPSTNRLGVGTACREIIHERVKKLRAKENERLSQAVTSLPSEEEEEEFDEEEEEEFDDEEDKKESISVSIMNQTERSEG
jgi:hypothetical protein